MKAKSIKGKSTEEIKTALAETIDNKFKPTLAIIFLSADKEIESLCTLFNTEGISIFGASTGGEFIDEEVGTNSIAILLLELNHDYFKVIIKNADTNTSRHTANEIANIGLKTFSNPGFVIGLGGRTVDGTMVIAGLKEKLPANTSIFGGMAGTIVDGGDLLVFDSNNVTKSGIIALIIDNDKIDLTGFATSGWKPIATFHTVTKSEGHTIYTINNEPAMDMIAKYMGTSVDLSSTEEIYSTEATPIQLYRDNAPSVLREIILFNGKTRAVKFAGPVPEGSKFRFSLPPDFDIIEKIKSDCTIIKEQQQPEADALLVFSCSARLVSLGPLVNNEIDEIKSTWNSPMVGFFSFAEIGKYLGGETEFHNNTCCVVALKEK